MQLLLLSEATAARRRIPIHLVDATDGITKKTGETGGQPQLSKNGAAFGNTTATLVELTDGLYYVELTAAELNDKEEPIQAPDIEIVDAEEVEDQSDSKPEN